MSEAGFKPPVLPVKEAVIDLALAVGRLHVAVGHTVGAVVASRAALDASAKGDHQAMKAADAAMHDALQLTSVEMDHAWDQLKTLLAQLGAEQDG